MYKLTARQLLIIALVSGMAAASFAFVIQRYVGRVDRTNAAGVNFSEKIPEGITDPSVATDERNNIEVYRAISPGVVFITSTTVTEDFFGTQADRGSGSGSVIDDQGHILTNYHVIEGAQQLTVRFGGSKEYVARVVGADPDTDLAVIRVVRTEKERLAIVPLGDSDKLAVGQKVLAIGNPFGFDKTLTTGVISGLQRPIRARNGRLIEGAIQTDASINPGNSGGPLLDSHGRMIGVNSQILSPDGGGSVGVGFAIPISIVRRVVPQLIKFGYVNRPSLGITYKSVASLIDQNNLPVDDGILIYSVNPDGAAARAGLRGLTRQSGYYLLGDIITSIDGERITDQDDLGRILDKRQVGDLLQIEIVRGDGKRTIVPVRLLAPSRRSF